jgi:hypothetical protein
MVSLRYWFLASTTISITSGGITTLTTGSPYSFLGSYKDGGNNQQRALQKQYPGTSYTPDSCFALANAHSYKFFGLQFGGECW